ncbi:MAG: right-handed parallel beta-helix repeat-containing protein [Gammaproteobacteria bacterium]|nr:right-handed parallel beta-helix repeat-containing protein [Gammaproteobacteria bacterium]
MQRLVRLAFLTLFASLCQADNLPISQQYQYTVEVDSEHELYKAVKQANQRGNTLILIADGIYHLSSTLNITGNHVALKSASGDPATTILRGAGMAPSKRVKNLIRVTGHHFTFSGLTAESAPHHIIQIVGEANADYAVIEHCVLQNAYEQLLKVSHRANSPTAADHGIIRHCTFGYTEGIGPQYYIGGVDLHLGQHWLIDSNQFFGIASPAGRVAEHAIHLWNNSGHNQVINNVIINSDRGIGFGMGGRGNQGGLISGNIIYHADNKHPYADAGIILESSPDTTVKQNQVLQHHEYPNAIEYRFEATQKVLIAENGTNKKIRKRNSASAELKDNYRLAELPAALKRTIIERFPAHYQQQVFDTLYPVRN